MTKEELIRLIEPFSSEIEIFVRDSNDMPLPIKHIAYIPALEKGLTSEPASLEIIPMGSHIDMKSWLG